MQTKAHANFVRYAPRKVNQVLELVRNKPVSDALKVLGFLPKKPSLLIAKLIRSAVANSGRKDLNSTGLYVNAAWVGQGPVLKRMRAYAMGRGSTYKRKTCHLTVVVSDQKTRQRG